VFFVKNAPRCTLIRLFINGATSNVLAAMFFGYCVPKIYTKVLILYKGSTKNN